MKRGIILTVLALCLCLAALAQGLPRPTGPGDQGVHVLALQAQLRLLGYDPGEAQGAYTWETLRAVMAFQKDQGLRADGRAGRDSLLALFGKEKDSQGQTKMPYWYGGGSDIIPWGAVFLVQDVATGLTFSSQRMGGYSHLDAEPLHPFDTAAMFLAYGGQWSWDRRPVLLQFEGRVIAASMNGMPHGFSAIKTNGMPGHFCIHFFGSRGDGSQRVSDSHQACVVEAARASWQKP